MFPARWMMIWCLFGAFIIGSMMMYMLCQTFRKKTEFLKINKKAAENLSDESSEEEDIKKELKKEDLTKEKNDNLQVNDLEKIEEQEESFSEEDSINFSELSRKPDQPLGDLNLSQFETNSRYEHVRSHYDKNSEKIFQIKKKRPKKKNNKLGAIEEENVQDKENNKKRKRKRKKKSKPVQNDPTPEPVEKKKSKKKDKSFKFLIKRTEMKVFLILNFGLFCLFSFSTETLLLCFHNVKFFVLENGNFNFEIIKDKLSLNSNIVSFSLSVLFLLLIFAFTGLVFGKFHTLFRQHWKSKEYLKVASFNDLIPDGQCLCAF
jgi:hypothetical protein